MWFPLIGVLAAGWLAGLAIAAGGQRPLWAWLAFAGLAGVCLALLRQEGRLRLPLAFALALGLGGARYELARPPFGDPAFVGTHTGAAEVVLEGVVAAEPEERAGYTRLHLRVETLTIEGGGGTMPVQGVALVYAPPLSGGRLTAAGDAHYRYGDRLRVTGALEAPPISEGFAYREYLARQGVYAQVPAARVAFLAERAGPWPWQGLFDFKARALAVVEQIFPEPHAALLAGILLGSDGNIPADIEAAFEATGTAHIVAISGFNMAILAGLITAGSFRLLGRGRGTLAAIAGLAAYALLVGAGGSVVRAALMSSLALTARQIGRRAHGLNTLSAAAIAMTAFNPLWLWDVGFQLSATATLGLVLYAAPLESWVERLVQRWTPSRATARSAARLAGELLLLTLAAQVTTLPLTLYYFQRFSLVSPLANLLILPVQPAVMVLGGLALLLGLLWLPLGQLAAVAAWPFTAFTLAVVVALARVPGASFYLGEVAPAVAAVYYAALFGLTWLLSRPAPAPAAGAPATPGLWARLQTGPWPGRGLVVVGAAAVLAWGWYFSLPEARGRLRVAVLDVGAGDAVLIQAPGGGRVLVNGGPSGPALARGLDERLPLFARELDALVIAGAADENIVGLPVLLERYQVARAVVTGAESRSVAHRATLRMLNQQQVEIVSAGDLPTLELGDGVRLRVIADTPNGSVLRLEWRSFSMLLPVGLDAAGEAELIRQGLAQPATALLLADNGAASANSAAWIRAINPQVVVIAAEAGTTGAAPADEVLARLAGRNVLRTDRNGSVMIETNGESLWVEAQRQR